MINNYQEIKNKSGINPKQLVMFLHGYGSNCADLINLAYEFQRAMPYSHFISPDAPYICEQHLFGYQWFSLIDRDEDILHSQITESSEILKNFIIEQLTRFSLKITDLILIGFSQGAMMALNISMILDSKTTIIAYSGPLVKSQELTSNAKVKSDILIIHGEFDEVIPIDGINKTVADLKRYKFPFKYHLLKNLGHSINIEGIDLARKFLKDRFC